MSFFTQTIRVIERYGVLNFYLPFILTFSIFYALLRKSRIFGDPEKVNAINAIIAVVAAFYVIAYTPIGFSMSEFLSKFFTQTTTTIVGLMGVSLILALASAVGWKPECWVGKFTIILILVVIGLVIFIGSGGLDVFNLRTYTISFVSVEDVFFFSLIGLTMLIILLVTGWKPKPCQPTQGAPKAAPGG